MMCMENMNKKIEGTGCLVLRDQTSNVIKKFKHLICLSCHTNNKKELSTNQ